MCLAIYRLASPRPLNFSVIALFRSSDADVPLAALILIIRQAAHQALDNAARLADEEFVDGCAEQAADDGRDGRDPPETRMTRRRWMRPEASGMNAGLSGTDQ